MEVEQENKPHVLRRKNRVEKIVSFIKYLGYSVGDVDISREYKGSDVAVADVAIPIYETFMVGDRKLPDISYFEIEEIETAFGVSIEVNTTHGHSSTSAELFASLRIKHDPRTSLHTSGKPIGSIVLREVSDICEDGKPLSSKLENKKLLSPDGRYIGKIQDVTKEEDNISMSLSDTNNLEYSVTDDKSFSILVDEKSTF